MTAEEVARFAQILSEADRIRAQIAQDEAAARTDGGGELPLLAAALSAAEHTSAPTTAAA